MNCGYYCMRRIPRSLRSKKYLDIRFCMKCGKNQISSCALITKGSVNVVGRVHTYFCIKEITEYFDRKGTHSPVIKELKILGLLFADD